MADPLAETGAEAAAEPVAEPAAETAAEAEAEPVAEAAPEPAAEAPAPKAEPEDSQEALAPTENVMRKGARSTKKRKPEESDLEGDKVEEAVAKKRKPAKTNKDNAEAVA